MMAAPTQARRDLKAPLSRTQRSNGLGLIAVGLAVLALVAIGGFLFTMSLQQTPNDGSLQKAADNVVAQEKKEEIVWNVRKNSENEKPEVEKAAFKVEDKAALADEDTLIISTKHGKMRVVMRPDLSPDSVAYIRALVDSGKCKRCNLYRAEKPGILQGIMQDPGVNVVVKKGKCPPEYKGVKQDCPAHDPECDCHGPIMTKGMVGWAGGDTGPDFFFDTYERPGTFALNFAWQ